MNAPTIYTPERKKARIEIIPLIDVVFFLLATFVLFTLSLNHIASIGVRLPQAGKDEPQESMVYLQASGTGTYYWKLGTSGTPEIVSAIQLPSRLAAYRQSVPLPRVLIRGDSQAKLGAAVTALDLVRQAGITQVSLETVPSQTGR